ncbi:MAG: PAS domain-containing protein [Burkholderiales bacterium]|nr:PAS domain-containing protein [Burkholderiales bacterium]
MRNNQPVSQTEYAVPPGRTLVSVTDLKGRITYCNPAFVEVSGYSSAELLGQPHNLVRHPDMPSEAFRDLWATIQAKQPWTGLVKNRRKNGDYYWVRANATPMLDGDTVTGYLSVRTLPSRAEVAAAEQLYRRMRTTEAGVLVLHRGQVRRRNLLGRVGQLLTPGSVGKIVLIQILAAAVVVVGPALALPLGATLGLGVLAIALASCANWSVFTRPLQSLVDDANHLASGDLSHTITTGASDLTGQLQQALMQMSVNLRTVVADVRDEVDNLRDSVQEIADGNQDMSDRTESQASNLQQTAASMEQINGSAQQSETCAARSAELADVAADVTARSNEAVDAVAQTMQGITEASARIGEIVHLIEGVAFQTNILALNAAVEAARAGDAGCGFAVVASEVRSLAQRAAESVRDIRTLIADSAQRVNVGSERTAQARERMGNALGAVTKVRSVLEEIRGTVGEQHTGISQITEAIAQLDSITQQNAAMVEELAAAAKSVQGQVVGVSNSMRLFRLARGDLTLSQMDAVDLRRQGRELLALA